MAQMVDERTAMNYAWQRINTSEWDQIGWFVKLLNTDLSTLSSGEQLKLQEEFMAIEAEGKLPPGIFQRPPNDPRYWKPKSVPPSRQVPCPNLQTMREVQVKITAILTPLAEGRSTSGPTTDSHYYIRFEKTSTEEETRGLPRYKILRVQIGQPRVLYEETLPLKLAHLLELHAEKIRRCPGCQLIFVQFRKTRKYCGARCQSASAMRNLRARRKQRQPRTNQIISDGKGIRIKTLKKTGKKIST